MVQRLLYRLYTLSLFVTGVLKHRVQIVEIIHVSAVTIQALHSDVILHVPDGVYGIIRGKVHTDHWRFRQRFYLTKMPASSVPYVNIIFATLKSQRRTYHLD